jgi:phosphoenolpyruvate synthase/pyruvate phosphate dikinase
MSFPVITLLESARFPESEVGVRVHTLARLSGAPLHTPETYVIPASILEHLFDHNQFFQQLAVVFPQVNWYDPDSILSAATKLQADIIEMALPDPLLHALTQTYTSVFEGSFLAVRVSLIRFGELSTAFDHFSELYVKGEANLIESLLRVLAKLYSSEHLSDRFVEWQRGQAVPAALMLQKMIEPVSSGVALYHSPQNSGKHTVFIAASWGVYQAHGQSQDQSNLEQADTFEVDTRSWQVAHRTIRVKKHAATFHLDRVEQTLLPSGMQVEASLDDEQAIAIARATHQIAQHYLSPQVVEWAAVEKGIFLLSVQPAVTTLPQFHEEENEKIAPSSSPAKTNSTSLKVMTATNSLSGSHDPNVAESDGIGLLYSESIFLQLEAHPMYLIHHGKKSHVVHAIEQALRRCAGLYPSLPMWYRSQNFTSGELQFFPEGKREETDESNPFFGHRGGGKILQDTAFFDAEIDALLSSQKHFSQPLQMILPFVRTNTEFGLIKKHLAHRAKTQALAERLWIECDTPENLFRAEEYLAQQPAGLIINVTTTHALLHGLDPDNAELMAQYPLNLPLMKTLLRQLQKTVKGSATKIHLLISHHHRELIEMAVELGFDAVIVRPRDLSKTHILLGEVGEKNVYSK